MEDKTPLRAIYDKMVENNLTDRSYDEFVERTAQDGGSSLFDHLSQNTDWTRGASRAAFVSGIADELKKKAPTSPGVQPGGASSTSSSDASAAAPSAATGSSVDPFPVGRTALDRNYLTGDAPGRDYGLAARQAERLQRVASGSILDGKDDPVAAGEAIRKESEKDYSLKKNIFDSKTPLRLARREEATLQAYHDRLQEQEDGGADLMALQFGPKWEDSLKQLSSAIESGSYTPEQVDAYNQMVSSQGFKAIHGAYAGKEKIYSTQKEAEKRHPVLAEVRRTQEAADAESAIGGGVKETEILGWAGRFIARNLSNVASAIPTAELALSTNEGRRKQAYEAVSAIDQLAEWADTKMPAPTSSKRGMFEASVPFEGKQVVVRDGKIAAVYGEDGSPVDMEGDGLTATQKVFGGALNAKEAAQAQQPQKTFAQRFEESGGFEEAKKQSLGRFTGMGNLSSKLLNTTADMVVAAALGGGTKLGVALSTLAQTQHDAFMEAQRDFKMSAADAARYAIATSAVQGVLEAHVGEAVPNLSKRIWGKESTEASRLGLAEARMVAGAARPEDVAWARLKPVLHEVAMENVEEGSQSASDMAIRAAFNARTGANLENDAPTQQGVAESILLTTLATLPISASGMKGRSEVLNGAVLAAVNDPQRFAGLMDHLVDTGSLDAAQADGQRERIALLSAQAATFPANLSEEARNTAIIAQDVANVTKAAADGGGMTEGQQALFRGWLSEANKAVQAALATADQPSEEDGGQAEAGKNQPEAETVAENAAEPAEEPEFDPFAHLSDTPPVQRENLVPPHLETSPGEDRSAVERLFDDERAPVSDVAAMMGENGGGMAADAVTNEALNEAKRQGVKLTEADQVGLREFVLPHYATPTEEIGRTSARNLMSSLVAEYADHLAERKGRPMSARLEVETLADRVAKFFLSGGRVKPGTYGRFGDPRVVAQSKGTALAYFSPSGQNIDQIAQEWASEHGVPEEDVQQAFVDFIEGHETLTGPGGYAQRRIAEQRQRSIRESLTSTEDNMSEEERFWRGQATDTEVADVLDQAADAVSREADSTGWDDVDEDNMSRLFTHFTKSDGSLDEEALSTALLDPFNPTVLENLPASTHEKVNRILAVAAGESGGSKTNQGAQQAAEEGQPPELDQGQEPNGPPLGPAQSERSRVRDAVEALDNGAEGAVEAAEALLREMSLPTESTPETDAEMVRSGVATEAEALRGEDLSGRMEALREPPAAPVPLPAVSVNAEGRVVVASAGGARDAVLAMGGKWDFPSQAYVMPKGVDETSVRAAIAEASAADAPFTADAPIGTRAWSQNRAVRSLRRRIARAVGRHTTAASAIAALDADMAGRGLAGTREFNRVVSLLEQSFPGVTVVVDPGKTVRAAIAEGVPAWRAGRVAGFVSKDGTVHINPDVARLDTPIHELGHVWEAAWEKSDPEAHAKGIELVRGSEYEAYVRESGEYGDLDEQGILKEALAQAIGERGARIAHEGPLARFRRWLKGVFASFQRQHGFNPDGMTVHEFADAVALRMLAGRPLVEASAQRSEAIRAQFVGEQGAQRLKGAVGQLMQAKNMELNGDDPARVWLLTNWFRGADGFWRHEVPAARVRHSSLSEGDSGTLGELLDAPEVFAAYPSLLQARYVIIPANESAWANMSTMEIGVPMVAKPYMETSIAHEIQHLVQEIEGHAMGSAPETVMQLIEEKIAVFVDENPTDEQMEANQGEIERYYEAWKAKSRLDAYKKTAGEVEARNVAGRLAMMNAAERPGATVGTRAAILGRNGRPLLPTLTEDVAKEEQMFFFPAREAATAQSPDSVSPFLGAVLPNDGMEEGEDRERARFQFASAKARAHMAEEAMRSLIDGLVRNGTSTPTEADVEAVANRFNTTKDLVRKAWAASAARKASATTIFPTQVDARQRVRDWVAKWFYSEGMMPKEMFERKMERRNRYDHTLKQLGHAMQRLEEAAKREHGGYGPEVRKLLNAVMQGGDWGLLHPETARHLKAVRDLSDSLSVELAMLGGLRGKMLVTVLENAGVRVSLDSNVLDGEKRAVLGLPSVEDVVEDIANGRTSLSDVPREIADVYRLWASNVGDSGVNEVRSGQADRQSFVESVRQAMADFGGKIDGTNLSLATFAKFPSERTDEEQAALEAWLSENKEMLGSYLYRSYQVNDDPDWWKKVTPGMRADARRAIVERYDKRIQELRDRFDENSAKLRDRMGRFDSDMDAVVRAASEEVDRLEAEMADLNAKQSAHMAATPPLHGIPVRDRRIDASIVATGKLLAAARNAVSQVEGLRRAQLDDISDALDAMGGMDALSSLAKQAYSRQMQQVRDTEALARMERTTAESEEFWELQKRNVDSEIETILHPKKAPVSMMHGGTLGSVEPIRRRSEIEEEVRRLMGQYEDIGVTAGLSIAKLAARVEDQRLLVDMRDRFAFRHFFPPGHRQGRAYVQVAADSSHPMAPLNGWWTTPEIWEELSAHDGAAITGTGVAEWVSGLFNGYMKVLGLVKMGMTIYNPIGQGRNFFGNTLIGVALGVQPKQLAKGADAMREVWAKRTTEEEKADMERYVRLGVVQGANYFDEVRAAMRQMQGWDWFAAADEKLHGALLGKWKETYAASDDFWKIAVFESLLRKYSDRMYGTPYESLDAARRAQLEPYVARVVQDTMPTPARASRFVRALSYFPLVGTFVVFQSEMYRVTKNTVQLSLEEMKNPALRGMAMARMLRLGAVTYGIQAAIWALTRAVGGWEDEDEDRARLFMKPWQRFGELFVHPHNEPMTYDEKSGKVSNGIAVTNFGYLNPYKYFSNPVEAFLAGGQTTGEKAASAADEFIGGLFKQDVLFSAWTQLSDNENEWGVKIYNPEQDVVGEKGKDIAAFAADKVMPRVFKFAEYAYQAATKGQDSYGNERTFPQLLLSSMGLQTETINPLSVFSQHLKPLRERKEYDKAILRDVVYANKRTEKKDVDEMRRRHAEAEGKYNDTLREIGDEAAALQKLLVRCGMDAVTANGLISQKLRDQHFSKQEVSAIFAGTTLPLTMKGYDEQ